MSSGSGIWKKVFERAAHLVRGKRGIPGEVDNLRRDLGEVFKPMVAITCDHYSSDEAVEGTGDGTVLAATATQTSPRTILAGGLVKSTFVAPRALLYMVAGDTPEDVDGMTVTVYGKGIDRSDLVAEQTLSGAGGGIFSPKCFKSISRITMSAAAGTGATFALGLSDTVGFSRKVKSRENNCLQLSAYQGDGGYVAPDNHIRSADDYPPCGAYRGFVDVVDADILTMFYEYDAEG